MAVRPAPPREVVVRTVRRLVGSGVFLWVLSKGSWGFVDDIQFVQGSREEFFARFTPQPPAEEDLEALHRETLERAFKEPFWLKLTHFVSDRAREQWSKGLTKLLPLGDVTPGNRVQIFKDGDECVLTPPTRFFHSRRCFSCFLSFFCSARVLLLMILLLMMLMLGLLLIMIMMTTTTTTTTTTMMMMMMMMMLLIMMMMLMMIC